MRFGYWSNRRHNCPGNIGDHRRSDGKFFDDEVQADKRNGNHQSCGGRPPKAWLKPDAYPFEARARLRLAFDPLPDILSNLGIDIIVKNCRREVLH